MKRIAAAITLFTRVPAWKIGDIPSNAYSTAVVYWPLIGWLTGGIIACCILVFSYLVPMNIAVMMAIIARMLFTGALHEDGLADFCDGFGGGHDKDSILRIMKDSSIGTYGVIGLISYFLLLWLLLSSLPPYISAITIFAADPFAKCCASQITNTLNYARIEGAKNKISYTTMTKFQLSINILTGVAPLTLLILADYLTSLSIILPLFGLLALRNMMKRKIGGYTGDCCGASFIICEILMLIGVVIIF